MLLSLILLVKLHTCTSATKHDLLDLFFGLDLLGSEYRNWITLPDCFLSSITLDVTSAKNLNESSREYTLIFSFRRRGKRNGRKTENHQISLDEKLIQRWYFRSCSDFARSGVVYCHFWISLHREYILNENIRLKQRSCRSYRRRK